MISFVPIMRKQTYWILARFIRALILTKETDMDLSIETRQEIFLYSSRMDLLPGFPAPNIGYPRSTEEWMTISPYYKSSMETDELKSFMRRYGYMTAAMRIEEEERVRAAKEAKKEQMLKEKEQEKEREREDMEREKENTQLLQLDSLEEKDNLLGNADTRSISGGTITMENDKNEDVTKKIIDLVGPNQEMVVVGQDDAEFGMVSGANVMMKIEKGDQQLGQTEYVICSDVERGGEITSATSTTSGSSNTTGEDESDDLSSDDDNEDENLIDFSTSMTINATTAIEEDDLRGCEDEEAIFWQKIQEIKEMLDFAGVRQWTDESLHAFVMSGPIGLSVWATRALGKLRQEIQRSTVMLKEIDQGVLAAQNKIKEDREQAKRDLEVWNQTKQDVHSRMDGLSGMRQDDLKAKAMAIGGITNTGGGGFLGLGSRLEGSSGKRRSVYVDGMKKKKRVKSLNPFETPQKGGTPGTSGERSETMD